jgi:hypothetical protein
MIRNHVVFYQYSYQHNKTGIWMPEKKNYRPLKELLLEAIEEASQEEDDTEETLTISGPLKEAIKKERENS